MSTSDMTSVSLFGEIVESVAPIWVEVCFFIFFPLGFAVFRRYTSSLKDGARQKKLIDPTPLCSFDRNALSIIDAQSAAGCRCEVLTAWRACCDRAPTPHDRLPLVAQALLSESPASMVEELVNHIQRHAAHLCHTRTSLAILDVIARSGDVRALDEMYANLHQGLRIPLSGQVYEVLLGGYASVGDETHVQSLITKMQQLKVPMSARGHSLLIKGFLKSGKGEAVLVQMVAMQNQGFIVPQFATAQLLRVACDRGDGERIFDGMVENSIALSEDCITTLLDFCLKSGKNEFAARVEAAARSMNVALSASACQSLLRLAVANADTRALDLFRELLSHRDVRSAQCVGLLSLCAEVKFLKLAEEIVAHVRATGTMTVSVYSALMKVYAYCGMFDKACDLYEDIVAGGMEPDAVMYGCLMKFAVECGRTELSRTLAEKSPVMEIQSYMSLIRAAGRDRDVDAAFRVLGRVEASGLMLDLAVYNCVLDVCVNAGDVDRANKLVDEMRSKQRLDIITYNTLLKGYCRTNVVRALALLDEMRADGVTPNDVSYNCLINAAVNSGNMKEAWRVLESMENDQVKVDHYTVSIIMKSIRKTRSPSDLKRAFDLLERVDVCADEILMNAVLETCIFCKEYHRIGAVLQKFEASSLRPAMHTYGTLIRAAGVLKDCRKCWHLWRHMIKSRGMAPNEIVLGCMLDALVSNDKVEQAEELMNLWKDQVKPNSVMFSTLVKGFSLRRDSASALRLWHQCREDKVKLNNISYNCFIDSQARVGAMDEVTTILDAMREGGSTPDSITYSTVIKGYCTAGQLDKALEIFRGMQQQGLVKDAVTYNAVLDGCAKHGHLKLAEALVEDLESHKIAPSNYTVGVLVRIFGRSGDLDKAIKYAGEWRQKHNLPVSAIVQTTLITVCLQNRNSQKALEIFAELKAVGEADSKCYASLALGLHRMGEYDMSMKFVLEASKAGCPLGRDVLSQLRRGNEKPGVKVCKTRDW